MLVQPALIAHLLCRPVSIADTMGRRGKLQVLCKVGVLCYVFDPPLSGTVNPKMHAKAFFFLERERPLRALQN